MIRKAKYSDLPQIANVHFACFSKSFSTVLGKFRGGKLLQRFYKEYLDSVPELFLVATDDTNNVVGFCMGYYCEQNDYQKKFLKHNFVSIAVRTALLLCGFNKVAWKKVMSILKKKHLVQLIDKEYLMVSSTKKGDLLSICVLPEYRGKGLSAELVSTFERILKNQEREFIQLTVELDNDRAIRFYNKMGYKQYKVLECKNQGMYKVLE